MGGGGLLFFLTRTGLKGLESSLSAGDVLNSASMAARMPLYLTILAMAMILSFDAVVPLASEV